MTLDLFDLGETLSPRLKWMKKHGIRTYCNRELSHLWMALTEHNFHARGETEDEALIALAKKIGIPSWKEEAL